MFDPQRRGKLKRSPTKRIATDISNDRVEPGLRPGGPSATRQCFLLTIFYALNFPPNPSSASMICADHCATSSSRSVRSAD